NRWVIKGNKVRYDIEREYMKRKARVRTQKEIRNIFLQKNEVNHISLGSFRTDTNSGNKITFLALDKGMVTSRMDAKAIKWLDSLSVWSVTNYSIRDFDKNGSVMNTTVSKKDTLLNLNFSPEDITQQSKKPDEMTYQDLTTRIKQLKENGVDTTKWEVDRYFKISFAFTNFIIVLFGIPLVVVRPKGGLSFGAGMGIFVIFIYYVFIKLGMSVGYSGITTPMVAAWMGNVIFFIGGISLLAVVRK
ncbi:MAG: LptF/LptG family permease, partial [Candidatus Neomarinimicrobiota bacterium]|nr:LptF/LptG family permease [Candidatus Neomarinimicrobiota bacterium]